MAMVFQQLCYHTGGWRLSLFNAGNFLRRRQFGLLEFYFGKSSVMECNLIVVIITTKYWMLFLDDNFCLVLINVQLRYIHSCMNAGQLSLNKDLILK